MQKPQEEHIIKSSYRGHPIVWDEKNRRWLYEDNKEPLPGWGGEYRGCVKCSAPPHESHESDPCLGNLPGVDNACCGHGHREMAYVRFDNGVVLKGFTVETPESEKERVKQ